MSEIVSLVVVGLHSPVFLGGLFSRCGHRLLLSCGIWLLPISEGDSGHLSSCCGATSGGSLWGGYSLLVALGHLINFHGFDPL